MDRWGRVARKKQPVLVPWLALAILKWIHSNKVEIPREEGGLDFKHIQHTIKHYQSGWCLQDALVRSILMVAPPPTLLSFEEKPGSMAKLKLQELAFLLSRWVPYKRLSVGDQMRKKKLLCHSLLKKITKQGAAIASKSSKHRWGKNFTVPALQLCFSHWWMNLLQEHM